MLSAGFFDPTGATSSLVARSGLDECLPRLILLLLPLFLKGSMSMHSSDWRCSARHEARKTEGRVKGGAIIGMTLCLFRSSFTEMEGEKSILLLLFEGQDAGEMGQSPRVDIAHCSASSGS